MTVSPERPRRRRRKLFIFVGIVSVAIAAAGALIFLGDGTEPSGDDFAPYLEAIVVPVNATPEDVEAGVHPTWSADGTRFAFEATRRVRAPGSVPTPDSLSFVYVDGCGPDARLAPGEGAQRSPAWSPDGTQIAFIRDWDRDELWVSRIDGSDARRLLTANRYGLGKDLAWSPDGTQIAFTMDGQFSVIDVSGDDTPQSLFGLDLGLSFTEGLSWSPDGTRIAFAAFPRNASDRDVFAINVDGSNLVNVTDSSGDDLDPAWSPDGSRIAFVSHRGKSLDVFVIGADGTGATRLTDTPEMDTDPAWSPDGSRIAFVTDESKVQIIEVDHLPGVSPRPPTALPASGAECPGSILPPPPQQAAWLVAALERQDFPPSRAPEWLGNTFWGSATWSELDLNGNVVTWTNQPFTLSTTTVNLGTHPTRRLFSCQLSPWEKPDPLEDLLNYMDSVQQAALGGSFGSLLSVVTGGDQPSFPLLAPANCQLKIPTTVILNTGRSLFDFSTEEFAYGRVGSDSSPYDMVIGEDHIDGGRSYTQGVQCDSEGAEFHIDRVGWIAESGGTVIKGDWIEWPECRRVDAPLEGVVCASNVPRYDLEFVSDSVEEHRRFKNAPVEFYGGETIVPGDFEIVTICDFATRGSFFAFSLPTDMTGLPAAITATEINYVLTATSLARSDALTQLGAGSEEETQTGFIETVAEIRKEALTWIVRNMPVYDTGSGTWSSFESYAIGLGRDSGVPPDSRLATDPVGTAADLAFGNASTSDMINWLGLGS